MEDNINIREMKISDLFVVEELEQRIFSMPWSLDSFRQALHSSNQHFLVADIDGKVVGYIGALFIIEEVQILNLAVAEDYRRRHIGIGLLHEMMELAGRELGYATVTLEVRASNAGAIRLYKGYGFEQIGRRKDYYSKPTEDAILMGVDVCGCADDMYGDEDEFDDEFDDGFDADEFEDDEFDEDEYDADGFDEDEFEEDEFDEDEYDEDGFDEDEFDADEFDDETEDEPDEDLTDDGPDDN